VEKNGTMERIAASIVRPSGAFSLRAALSLLGVAS